MNIIRENIDALNAILIIRLEKNDYETKVKDVLADYKKKARIDGFRPGKVPLGLINKMYRKPVLAEELNKLVSESVSKYLFEEKLNILGEPLPHKNLTKTIDWDVDTEFEFKFDLGLAPEIDVKISPKDKYPFYAIKIDDAMIGKYIESYTQRFGELVSVEKPGEKDLLKADLTQLESDNNPLPDGIRVTDVTLSIEMIKDEAIKSKFLAVKKEESLIVDLKKAYPNDTEIAAMLKIEKEKVALLNATFQVHVTDISRFKSAEINQELFDKIYGQGAVNSEKEFRDKIKEDAAMALKADSDYRFRIDVKEMLIKKTKFDLPKEFLKRWLFEINEGKFSAEQIEKDFDHFAEDLKWQLIKDQISADNKLVVNDDDLKQAAKEMARMQFRQYGMSNVPDEHLEQFATRMMERKEDMNNIKSRVAEDKVIGHIKSTVKLDEKEISSEKFNKLFENK